MLKVVKYTLLTFTVVFLCLLALAFFVLRSSLPQLDGTLRSEHVQSDLVLSRDNIGHAVITATDREHAAYGLGIAHAQDRLFQMDLQRRSASGRLAEIIGPAAIAIDQKARFYQFSNKAQSNYASLPS